VLENDAVFGSMNANLRHDRAVVEALLQAEREWPARLVSRRVLLNEAARAREPRPTIVRDRDDGPP